MKEFILEPKISKLPSRKQTHLLQNLCNACQKEGGKIIIPAGVFTLGSIELFSNTTLILKKGCLIKSSLALQDFTDFGQKTDVGYVQDPYFVQAWHLPTNYFHALFCAYNAQNITIEGEAGAVIDGCNLKDSAGEEGFRGPMGLVFARVKNLRLAGYEIINSPNWAHAIINCQKVTVNGVRIIGGHDGFNLHHSSRVKILDCHLETGDDCLAGYDIKNLLVKDCCFNTACNFNRIGGQNLVIQNCVFFGPGNYPHLSTGDRETHEFFKYYALKTPTEKIAAGNHILFKNFQIRSCRALIRYDAASPDKMQGGAPLKELAFNNFQVFGLSKLL